MTDPLRYIDRIGRLKVGASSGSYVRVDSCDLETTEYCVTMLPDNQEEDDTHRVKAADIEFQTTPEFVDKFLNPPHFIIQGNLDMKNIPSGSIVDFTECTTDPIVESGKLFVRGSYRFLGGNIVFRRCAFRGVADGLKVGSGNARVNVLFEGGTVYYDGDHGATVDTNAQLTMRDVAIGGSGVGVFNKGGGKLTLNQCSLNGNKFGVVMSGEESETEMTSCSFHSNDRCGVMADGGTLTMVDCTIDDARECGIIIVDQAGERVQEVHNVVIASPENIEKLGKALSTVWSLKVKRLLTQLAMHLPLQEDLQYTKVRHCHHCDRLETSTPDCLMDGTKSYGV
eukprot:gene15269-17475_t